MSTTKVTDALRAVTEVDAAKITTGTIPEARITIFFDMILKKQNNG